MNKKTFLFFAAIVLVGCDLESLRMDYVPDKKTIEASFGQFLSRESAVKGIYGNHDVDSVLFEYMTADHDVLKSVEGKATKEEWKPRHRSSRELEIYRQYPPRGEKGRGFWSYEIARVSYSPESKRVCVGWLQIDASREVDKPENTTEGSWADKHLWPLYQTCKTRSN